MSIDNPKVIICYGPLGETTDCLLGDVEKRISNV